MLSNLASLIASSIAKQTNVTNIQKTTAKPNNPFGEDTNPFLSTTFGSGTYGKNQPVEGGYFAGYYNGKPNIVGRRLFIEV